MTARHEVGIKLSRLNQPWRLPTVIKRIDIMRIPTIKTGFFVRDFNSMALLSPLLRKKALKDLE
ncbi:MAG: hypothetical protein CME71_05140 [Halobacteriovorax sp.]|nr:hypothetical protein [Halobacteriovorax sp.]